MTSLNRKKVSSVRGGTTLEGFFAPFPNIEIRC